MNSVNVPLYQRCNKLIKETDSRILQIEMGLTIKNSYEDSLCSQSTVPESMRCGPNEVIIVTSHGLTERSKVEKYTVEIIGNVIKIQSDVHIGDKSTFLDTAEKHGFEPENSLKMYRDAYLRNVENMGQEAADQQSY